MKTLNINLKQSITYDHVEEIILTALEGGSNYWYYLKDIPEGKPSGEPLSSWIAQQLFNDPIFKLDVYDIENEDDLLGTVTQKSLLEALEICHRDYNHIYNDLIEGTGDAETADIIFQLATMKEVVFG